MPGFKGSQKSSFILALVVVVVVVGVQTFPQNFFGKLTVVGTVLATTQNFLGKMPMVILAMSTILLTRLSS